jgi:hypothetical protein
MPFGLAVTGSTVAAHLTFTSGSTARNRELTSFGGWLSFQGNAGNENEEEDGCRSGRTVRRAE